ncbi:hypothetical protein BgiBS90_017344 [Biomphalaria glabrata]|nr:hypothetical protein BgiBS90_017344 [Biomphalaria glabrata]
MHETTPTRPHPLDHTHQTTRTRPHPPDHTHQTTRTRPHPLDHTHQTTHTRQNAPDHTHQTTRTRPHPPDHTHQTTRTRPHPPDHTHQTTPTRPHAPDHTCRYLQLQQQERYLLNVSIFHELSHRKRKTGQESSMRSECEASEDQTVTSKRTNFKSCSEILTRRVMAYQLSVAA